MNGANIQSTNGQGAWWVPGPTTTTFGYDGDGGRVTKTVGTQTTTYIGKLYVCEGTSCAKMIFGGGQRIAIKQVGSGSTSYFHPDHLGSTSVLTNGSGVKEENLVYYPYGETFTNTGTVNVAYKTLVIRKRLIDTLMPEIFPSSSTTLRAIPFYQASSIQKFFV